jgi:uncharacterized protein (UPF0332 family)
VEKTGTAQAVKSELKASAGCLASALNNLAGPYGREYRSSIKELYFACFHVPTALLVSKGIRAKSHDAAQELLALHFVKPAALPADTSKKFNALMDRRNTADYKTFVPVDASDVLEFRPWICGFIRKTVQLLGKSAPAKEAAQVLRLVGQFERIKISGEMAVSTPDRV